MSAPPDPQTRQFSDEVLSLLEGTVDTHVHSSPDSIPRSVDDLELARSAAQAGMTAIVLKNHHAPTAHRAYVVEKAVGGLHVLGGVALNDAVGGLNPAAVEVALAAGGRIVWMPTTSAENQIEATRATGRRHPSELRSPARPVSLHDQGTREPLDAILELIRDADAVLATGHLSAGEVDLLVDRAHDVGVRRIVVTHPESPTIDMPVEQQRRLAARGVLFERCFHLMLPPRSMFTSDDVVGVIRTVGLESTIVASDLGQARNLPPTPGFGAYLEGLKAAGLSDGELRTVARDNACRLLGL